MLAGLDFTDSERLNQFAIFDNVAVAEVTLQSASLTDKHEEPTSTVIVFLVGSEVVRDLVNSSLQNGNLNLGRSGVSLGGRILLDSFRFNFFV